jgi:hypothetical protein
LPALLAIAMAIQPELSVCSRRLVGHGLVRAPCKLAR